MIRCRDARAFTLLEVLLAIALVALVAGAVGTMITTIGERRDTLLRALRDQRTGDILIQRLESDLLAAIAGGGSGGGGGSAGGVAAGVRGEATRLTVLTRAVWLAPPGEPSAEAETPEDLQSTEYAFDSASRMISVSRRQGAQSAGSPEPLGGNVARVRFRYFNGQDWETSFDSSAADALPVSIEVAVWFGEPPQPEGGPASSDENAASDGEDPDLRWPVPDRLRVITIPDGPGAAWSQP